MAADVGTISDLLDKAMATVNRALGEFIARRGRKRLVDLFGRLDWDDYDYKIERSCQRTSS